MNALALNEAKVLRAIEPGCAYLVVVIPGKADVDDLAADAALAELKKRKLVAFEGRDWLKKVYTTADGKKVRESLLRAEAAA